MQECMRLNLNDGAELRFLWRAVASRCRCTIPINTTTLDAIRRSHIPQPRLRHEAPCHLEQTR
eukprot:4736395-Pleurochrysis_carterae.AAC.1